MPLAGIRCRFTAMLMERLHAEQQGEPGRGETAERVFVPARP